MAAFPERTYIFLNIMAYSLNAPERTLFHEPIPHPHRPSFYQPAAYCHAAAPDGRAASHHHDGHGQYLYGGPCRLLCHFRRITGGFHQYSGDPGFLCPLYRRHHRLRPVSGAEKTGTRCPFCGADAVYRNLHLPCNSCPLHSF